MIISLLNRKSGYYRTDLNIAWKLSALLGHPQNSFPTIHVAGTNGKGSVCFKIAKALEKAGKKVGLFSSPHIEDFFERITINGTPISLEEVENSLQLLIDVKEASFFEITTFLAFDYFRRQNVDIAVIETGIGGLYDATNVLQPILSIITSVALDHQGMLGQTQEEIAFQKAGIIKPHTPVVIGPEANYPIIRTIAEKNHAPLHSVKEAPVFYDLENQAIAKKALEILRVPIEGVEQRPLCRFEQIGDFILDVAHNPNGIARLLQAYELHFPGIPFSIVFGCSKDKDLHRCLSLLAKRAKFIYLVQADSPKAAPVEMMAQILQQSGFHRFAADLSIQKSLEASRLAAERTIVCGSFYIMQEARDHIFRIQVGQDQLSLSRC